MSWRSPESFPPGNGEWEVKERTTTRRIGDEDVKAYVEKVSSQMGLGGPLIASPTTAQFLPPIRVPELQDAILSSVAGKLKVLAWIALSGSLLCALALAAPQLKDASTVARMAALMALIAAYWFYNHRVASRDRPIYLEWSIFLDWQRRCAGASHYVAMGVIGAFGLLQLGYTVAGYEPEAVFYDLGVVFALVDQGEYWRFLIGPFLHAGFSHWALNFLLCLLALPYLTPFKDRWSVLLIGYASIVLSGVVVYAQYRLGFAANQRVDSFAGVSALIYFACGFAIANTMRNKDWYPRQYTRGLVVSTIILLASPHVMASNISFAAHATGLVVGLLAGLIFNPSQLRSRS